MLIGRDSEDVALSGDELELSDVIRGQSEGAHQRADAGTGEKSDHPDGGGRPAERSQTVRGGCVEDVLPDNTGTDPSGSGLRVDDAAVQPRVRTGCVALDRYSAVSGRPTATRSPRSLANRMTSATSLAVEATTTAAGCTGTATFHGMALS